VTINNMDKAIIEEWSTEWGRIQTFLGVEVPFTNSTNQTSLWFTVQDPVTEIFTDSGDVMSPMGTLADGTQIWKIAHNGVDTHPIHFHLFNVQVINRVDWAGFVKPPEPNELGWKETIRMNPGEATSVIFKWDQTSVPFTVPTSPRATATLNLGTPNTSGMGLPPTPGVVYNEYVWHCHILEHEEHDMMRPLIITGQNPQRPNIVPTVATVSLAAGGSQVFTVTAASGSYTAASPGGTNSISGNQLTVTYTATGTYTVTVTDGGLSSTVSVTVTA
jgi:hypothetical protein